MSNAQLREETAEFARIIKAFSLEYALEIESIAAASNTDPLYIYALNSRSEIYNNTTTAECTTVYVESTAVLAQNWDWSEPLEHLVVLARIERDDNHRICMLTEPGIIGKIGMNSRGLGTCLNILKHPESLSGVPVHILLRAILDCGTIEEARQTMVIARPGKASHVLVANGQGDSNSIEFDCTHESTE